MLNITSKQAIYFALALTILFVAPDALATLDTQLDKVSDLFVHKLGKTGLLVGTVVGIVYSIFTGKIQQAFVIFGVLLASTFILNWVQSDGFFDFFKVG
ncbi:MAG: hypothetical protein CMM87_06030 [Rickettsiales bacterium]|nr:hypothetical protein [Rickettsiales bacterium]|tara:strand:+ start:8525 stop:8821 length:297 start_codon:yes stop_codon:yes gene_type:complete